ncbi:Cytochrome P450 monooxygenase BOT1 [Colletotrichum sp. SAR 10_70]|nr:Cytochrome P450 monooxygenase BOT1 [Colletotrichum sp. SAR 10_71]KAI8194492.1 Cytochrome P450 monooxygenase BOT1 [Colletotrichum sp. SAR 10_70]KAI8199143.1 Cytochrome P450 monooxygenase BOT1 [Colletotrichum sp. SAR 10_65]KAI8229630.1 Cytochrome P450 monooxygenase BOT1 [Colletotrichum sp. SAR 10_86]
MKLWCTYWEPSKQGFRKIPGPWYAAATSWYEFYYDVVLDGQLVRQYPILHEKYGPVIRISPDRIHVSDPSFFREVYANNSRYLKDSGFYQAFGTLKYSIVMLIDPEEHKQRRNTVKSLFSTKQMDQLAPSILDVVKRAMIRAQRSYDRGAPLNIQALWSSVTVDTIMSVLFDRQMNFVDSDEEMPPFLDAMTKFADNFLLTKHFPLMNRLAVGLPMSIAASDGRPTYFDLLLRSNAKMPNGLNREALVDEAFVLCFAGTDTTGIGLSLGTYYLLKNPEKLNKMLDELKTVKTNAEGLFEYRELCNLPYLSTVSQAIRTIHDNPDIFPEPERFIPERWLGENGWELEKWFVPFSKGTRACIGLNVAYMEMYLCLANLFTRFNMSLYKTDDNTTQWADGPAARIRESVKVNLDSVKM